MSDFFSKFYEVMIKEENIYPLLDGLKTTFIITFGSLVIGVILGVIVASVRSTYDKNYTNLKKKGGLSFYILWFFNILCKIYLTVIRGTPVVVQLFIFYLLIFNGPYDGTLIGTLAFGINSGAYVAEIFRGGIMSIDNGQFEAGRSLGLNYFQTMIYIVIPQMFKVVLPTLCNEFIVLLKETSVVGYVGVADLTKAGNTIGGTYYCYFVTLITVAIIYLIVVIIFTKLVSILERRLRSSDH